MSVHSAVILRVEHPWQTLLMDPSMLPADPGLCLESPTTVQAVTANQMEATNL